MTDKQMTRCLAHDIKPREFWPCANTCARSLQIGADTRPSENVVENACNHDTRLPMFVPMGGFPRDDVQ